jgi:hypothetical protein
MKRFILPVAILLLFLVEILRVYLIMPFPGSQKNDSISIAYWLHNNIGWIRLTLIFIIAFLCWKSYRKSGLAIRWITASVLMGYIVLFYFFNYKFLADKMFRQTKDLSMAGISKNKMPADKLVIGISLNGEERAYPIQLIGYHHQVRDTFGNTPVMVTYCTVCRTGRVFSPVVNGKTEQFRLVGMDHFNAMFEDQSTKSWWQQATGIAVAGPLKGSRLKELSSQQLRLDAWLKMYPNSQVMQADSSFKEEYAHLEKYDKGLGKSDLTKRDSGSWKMKSWVLGIEKNGISKAYDWNELVTKKLVQDSFAAIPLLFFIEKDTASFYVYQRQVAGRQLHFQINDSTGLFRDSETGSSWNAGGWAIDGALKGNRLEPVQVYQEFWHSWQTFHPGTEKYPVNGVN